MTVLYATLALSGVLLLYAALGAYLRVRRQLRQSDARLKQALEELDRERQSSAVGRGSAP